MITDINTFPNELASNKEKDSLEFAFKYAQAIWSAGKYDFFNKRANIAENRKYAAGTQNVQKYKKKICGNDMAELKEKYLKADWENRVKLLPKMIRKTANGIDMGEFLPRVYAIDPLAKKEKERRKKEKEELFYAKDFIINTAIEEGSADIPIETLPASKEQIEIEDEETSLDVEIAEEMCIENILTENCVYDVLDDVKNDLMIAGIGVVRVDTDKTKGVKIEYVNPEFFIHEKTNDRNFRNCRYFGEVKRLSIAQVKQIAEQSEIEITDGDIVNFSSNNYFDYNENEMQDVTALFFTFKTYNEIIYKKKKNRETGRVSLIDRSKDGYEPKQKSDISEKIRKTIEVWYEGIAVIDTQSEVLKIIQYKKSENLPQFNSDILPKYIAVAPRLANFSYNSIVDECKELIDEIQILEYKRRHLTYSLRGNVTQISISSVNETAKTMNVKPLDVISLYEYLGIIITGDIDEDGEQTRRSLPIQDVPSYIPYSLNAITQQLVYKFNQLKELFGYQGADEARQDEKTMATGAEIYRLSDNLTMKDYSDFMFKFFQRICQTISSRLDDIFQYSFIKERYINIISGTSAKVIQEYGAKRAQHHFGIYYEIKPKKEEIMFLIQRLNIYEQQGILTPVETEMLKSSKNLKLSYRLLDLKIKERRQAMAEQQRRQTEAPLNANQAAAKTAGEVKMQLLITEYKLKSDLEVLKAQLAAQGGYDANKLKIREMDKNFEAKLAAYKKDRDENLAKERQNLSAKNQAELIKLRHELNNNKNYETEPDIADESELATI